MGDYGNMVTMNMMMMTRSKQRKDSQSQGKRSGGFVYRLEDIPHNLSCITIYHHRCDIKAPEAKVATQPGKERKYLRHDTTSTTLRGASDHERDLVPVHEDDAPMGGHDHVQVIVE